MNRPITTEAVEAHIQCPRKAFLLLCGEGEAAPHEYQRIIEEQEVANREAHCARLASEEGGVVLHSLDDLAFGRKVLLDAVLAAEGLEARCDALKRVAAPSGLGAFSYEPIKVVGTEQASKTQAIGLAYLGHVLGQVQQRPPASGTLVRARGGSSRVNLTGKYKQMKSVLAKLMAWAQGPVAEPPPVILNKHCPACPFREACRQQAEKEDNLSLLDRMTPKLMQKYHNKGIFTVRQLSHIYKPRRSRKKAKRQVRHNLELQALAIRTGKVHVEHLPELTRGPVELVVDLEGVPDRDSYYLAGLLVCKAGEAEYLSFWADDEKDEAAMWSALIERVDVFPDAPIYHYGSYEKKAFATLAKRHGKGGGLANRLVNVASFVYGKVYFPVRSNGLKPLGRFLGAVWTDPEASGLQSLIWRHRWEATRDERHKQSLLQYNREDCEAVRLLVDRLDRIKQDATTDPDVDFARRPKLTATARGRVAHQEFERILRNACEDGSRRSVRIRAGDTSEEAKPKKKRGAKKGHQMFQRIIPTKVGRTVRVQPRRKCPRGHGSLALDGENMAERTVIDLVFTRNGSRKTITRLIGKKGHCPKCGRDYLPPAIARIGNQVFGHGFQAWTVYQRVILRLPYRVIAQVTEHLFGVGLCTSVVINFLGYLAAYYAPTEAASLQAILKSAFVHVDETKINIEGVDHYVWVFTDGKHVVFRVTQTRETDIVREVLAGYKGVLVSDFYPGYDGVPCRQQKCLVHLIRDINDDLWASPFDKELEVFAVEVQALLVPILAAVNRFGLKARHLRKFEKEVERFYQRNVAGREYASEHAAKYQKRFERYRDSLFTFLTQDGIPWENNMAERAIRQLAVQRKISGSFSKRVAPHYLLLLAISQTCRFQEKSFLKFLLSKETDLDQFRRTKPIKYSVAVDRRRVSPAVLADEKE